MLAQYTEMSTSRYDHASPSLPLKRGAYRMRAPRSRVPTSPRRSSPVRGPETFNSREKHYAVLIIVLVSATLMCFGMAYYLFTTRWDSPVHHPIHTSRSDEAIQVVPYDVDDELRVFAPG